MNTQVQMGRRARRMTLAVLGLVAVAGAACSSTSTPGTASTPTTTAVAGTPAATANARPVLGPADETSAPQKGGALVFAVEAEPDGLDPSRSSFDASGHMLA